MVKKLTLFLLALIAAGVTAHAQYCGFDLQHARVMSADPGYAQRVNNFNSDWAQVIQNNPNSLIVNTPRGPVYEIPVVVHVIHTGGAVGSIYNPSDATINGMINYLNASYAATWAAYPDSLSGGTYFPVRFVLAKRSPTCGATTGINRVNGSSLAGYSQFGVAHNGASGANEEDVKALSIWDNNDYYNVWIVNKIDGQDGTSGIFVAGYAYFPGAPAGLDGTIMLATQAVAGEITLPHEIGHAFSLYHTFQGGTTTVCPPNNNCATDGDMICDTQPERQSNFNCPVDPNPCTGGSYNFVQHNFMDYSSCQDRFTPGQRTRFLASLLSNNRASLISSLGTTAPTTPAVTAAACVPPSISLPSNNSNAGIFYVRLNDMMAASEGGYNDDGNRFYIDRSCIQRANVTAGQSYTLSVRTGVNPERVRVYIDYNNDGTFGTTELVYSHDGSGFNELHTTTITIPATAVTCVPLRMRVVSDRTIAAAPTACGALTYGQAEDYSVQVQGPSNTASVTIALTAGTNPSCVNTPLTFTATPGGTATNPTYKWYINGTAVPGATGTTLTTALPANGSQVTARIFYNGPCGADSSVSNGITIARNSAVAPTATVTLVSGSNPGCAGQPLTFVATSTNGGSAPAYTWQTFDGTTYTNVSGVSSDTFSTSALPCGNGVRAVLVSSLSCASPTTVNSNTITYTCSPVTTPVTIAQTSGSSPSCAGQPLTFTATGANPGPSPIFSWVVNGNVVVGATGTTFTTSTLRNGDSVQVIYISSNTCATNPVSISNAITADVIPLDTPVLSVIITQGSNPGCTDSLLEFSASSTSVGTTGYTWFVNGGAIDTGTTLSGAAFVTGDQIFVRAIAGPGCHVSDTLTSAPLSIVRNATPNPPVISFIGNMLIANAIQVQWYGPSGLIPGATGQTLHPAGPGSYYARALNNGCPSGPSNVLQVSLLTIGSYNLSNVQIYPNPTTGQLNLDWGSAPADVRITVYSATGQALLHDAVKHATRKTMNLSSLAAGNYFVVLQDEQGRAGTVRITLTK